LTTYAQPTILGCQTPSKVALPANRKRVNREAVDLARAAGLDLDPWQEFLVQETLAESDQTYFNDVLEMWMPKYAAYEAGIVVSRQNGKGTFLEARALAGMFLLGERLIAWTAHEMPTAKEGFQRLEAIVTDNPELAKEVKHIHYSNGNEGIELKSGQRVIFKTRTKKALRGFTVDTLLLDEAMILDPDMMAAMMFAVSARPNAQLVYTGSAGDENSIQFGRVRRKALELHEPRTFFAEWSADVCDEFCSDDCGEHDPIDVASTYAKANPGLGYRIEVDNIDSERTSMDRERFCRERLSVGTWPVDGEQWAVIDEDSWNGQWVDDTSVPVRPLILGVDVNPERTWSCLAVCGFNEQGMRDVQVTFEGMKYDHQPGTNWVVPRIKRIWKQSKLYGVAIDEGSQAGVFIDELEKAGVRVIKMSKREYGLACGEFVNGVKPRKGNAPSLVHHGQPMLNTAVAGAVKRDLSDLWAWDRKNTAVDITPLVAATNAAWGHRKVTHKPRPRAKAAWG
jgi:phage terminase large subunit-like protein